MTTTATAAIHREVGGDLSLETVELEAPRADEIRVKMVGTGICHTDVKIMETDYVPLPIVLGHEGAGIVEAVGSNVHDLAPGDRVAMSIDSCGACPCCLRGSPAYCDQMMDRHFAGSRLDGSSPISQNGERIHGVFFAQSSFATHAIGPARAAVKVDDDVPLELMGPLGCGIQTGAGVPLNIIADPRGASLAVFGAGSVGLAAVMGARVAGMYPIVAVDRVESRLELALELGASHVVNTNDVDPVEGVRSATNGGADHAFEATGVLINQAFDALNALGQLILAATWDDLTFSGRELMHGKSVRGVLEGDSIPRIFIPQLVDLYRRGELPLERLVKYYDFADISSAVADSNSGVTIKPIIRF